MTRRTSPLGAIAASALAAVLTALTIGPASAAPAADPCGPGSGSPARYAVVVHDPVVIDVPAVTHSEWSWERTIRRTEQEYILVTSPEHEEITWTRSVPGPVQYLWARTGEGLANGAGTETVWAGSAPGPDWSGPLQSRPGPPTTETATSAGDSPEGDGWVAQSARVIPAEVESGWAQALPPGSDPTGRTRESEETETSPGTSETPPAGSGWTRVPGSERTVVDIPAQSVTVHPGWTEQILIAPATPPIPCGEVIHTGPGQTAVIGTPPRRPGDGTTPQATGTGLAGPGSGTTVAGPRASHRHGPGPRVLPQTGAPATAVRTACALSMIAIGSLLIARGRRRA